MWQLYQFPLCPFSRKVRLHLAEHGIAYDLVRENPWYGRDEFLKLNPTGRTPVLHDADKGLTLIDSRAICEYFEEMLDKRALIVGSAAARAEIRRLVALFDEDFFFDVTAPLLEERMKKRLFLRAQRRPGCVNGVLELAEESDRRVRDLGVVQVPGAAGPVNGWERPSVVAPTPTGGSCFVHRP